MKTATEIMTPKGIGHIQDIYTSELGYLMLRVFIPGESKCISYNLGKHSVTDNIFSRVILSKLPNTWLHQYLYAEDIWYLTKHHPTDGVLEEHFFDTEEEFLKYVTEHKITLKS